MKRVIDTVLLLIVAFSLSAIAYFIFVPPEPPIEYLDGSKAEPPKVKAGESISITRHYSITRGEKITIARRMRRGDCATGCATVDLLSSDIVVKPGNYFSSREIHIPIICTPGIWSLEFQAQWEDRLGRTRVVYAPPLDIEVSP